VKRMACSFSISFFQEENAVRPEQRGATVLIVLSQVQSDPKDEREQKESLVQGYPRTPSFSW